MLHSICQQIWKTQKWPQDCKMSVFIPTPKKGNAKESSNTIQLCSFHMLSRLCSKSSKPSFSSTWTESFQMYKQGFKEAEESDSKLPTFTGSCRKQGNSRKTSTSALLTMLKALTALITTNCGKFLKRWEYQITLPVSWETCMQVKKWQLESDMEKWTDINLGKDNARLYIVTLLI